MPISVTPIPHTSSTLRRPDHHIDIGRLIDIRPLDHQIDIRRLGHHIDIRHLDHHTDIGRLDHHIDIGRLAHHIDIGRPLIELALLSVLLFQVLELGCIALLFLFL
ncbi:hypothetical protein BC936DRAFT_145574 [Jimgerdemannia flammicorona]|uniref:Uncharacterized protein n=1 Tax=Jimgerdemannia flammicorona TaxID=994334 RepID=A0A433D9N6_9FUNG|nr:hypothetical protein BC936DRAFT_145574 [Jimgerdemannia flammicorona]